MSKPTTGPFEKTPGWLDWYAGPSKPRFELPPGSVLTGLSRRVFEHGTVIACEGARLDTLQALLEEEERRHR